MIYSMEYIVYTYTYCFAAYTEEERSLKANQEKEKGNEAFRSGDFDEALIYYNRSISLEPMAAVVNNRAITYINMERFEDAILDCNTVLNAEPKNVKGKFFF